MYFITGDCHFVKVHKHAAAVIYLADSPDPRDTPERFCTYVHNSPTQHPSNGTSLLCPWRTGG